MIPIAPEETASSLSKPRASGDDPTNTDSFIYWCV